MRKVVKLATAALALVGAWKVASWMCEGTAWLLVNRGFWEPEAAAKSAPWILAALSAGLFISLYGMYEDNQRYSRQSYGCIENDHALNDEPKCQQNRRGA